MTASPRLADLGGAAVTMLIGSFGDAMVALGGGVLLVLILGLGWRKPTWLLMIALASLAIRPQLLWGGPPISWQWGLHQNLIVFALVMNALRYGTRTAIPWPILALVAVFLLNLLFGNLHRDVSVALMLESLALFGLPFVFPQIVLAPGSRRVLALTIMVTPLLSVVLGGLLQLADLRTVFSYDEWTEHWYRLEGATGNASVFGMLAFAGFAVALHEWTRPGRRYAIYLALVNLALVILSGTRMAIFASAVFLGTHVVLSEVLRRQLRQERWLALAGLGLVAATLIVYWPTLLQHTFGRTGETVDLNGRDELWSFYWQEFLLSPWFGRGLGSGFVASVGWIRAVLPTPHNEYLHLLVMGGVVGFVVIAGGIGLWYRQLLQVASPNDREFLLALMPALGAYAFTDNILIYSSAMAVYAYLGVVLTLPSSFALPPVAETAGEAWVVARQ
jgi:O-antigen ligase